MKTAAGKNSGTIFRADVGGPGETAFLAGAMAREIRGGQVIVLEGVIGAGKTFFVKAMASKLGARDLPVSASFNLMKTYDCERLKLRHFDLFRLSEKDIPYLGIDEFLGEEGSVCVFEWGWAARYLWKKSDAVLADIALAGDERRRIVFRSTGKVSGGIITRLEKRWRNER